MGWIPETIRLRSPQTKPDGPWEIAARWGTTWTFPSTWAPLKVPLLGKMGMVSRIYLRALGLTMVGTCGVDGTWENLQTAGKIDLCCGCLDGYKNAESSLKSKDFFKRFEKTCPTFRCFLLNPKIRWFPQGGRALFYSLSEVSTNAQAAWFHPKISSRVPFGHLGVTWRYNHFWLGSG